MTNSTVSNYVTQVPGELNIEMVKGNDLVFSIEWQYTYQDNVFNMDLTDYTFNAYVIPEDGSSEIEVTVDVTNYSLGQMNIIITENDLINLLPAKHGWYMNWTTPAPNSYVQTVLAGVLVLRVK